MKTVRKIVLATAALVCAALVLVPFAAAAGPGQGNNPGSDQGPGTFMQGPSQGGPANQGPGNTMMPGQGQNTDRGSGSQGQGNSTDSQRMPHDHGFRNMTGLQPEGNITQGNGTWDGLGLNAHNITFGPPSGGMNATDGNNWTVPGGMAMGWPGGDNSTAPADNMTVPNGTAPSPMGGNMTGPQNLPAFGNAAGTGLQNGNSPGAGSQQQDGGAGQAQSQDQKDSDLIAAFLNWLRGGGTSSS